MLRALGLDVPVMREVVDVRHQFDQSYVIDATATTEAFGVTATPWDGVVLASVAAPVTGTAAGGVATARH